MNRVHEPSSTSPEGLESLHLKMKGRIHWAMNVAGGVNDSTERAEIAQAALDAILALSSASPWEDERSASYWSGYHRGLLYAQLLVAETSPGDVSEELARAVQAALDNSWSEATASADLPSPPVKVEG